MKIVTGEEALLHLMNGREIFFRSVGWGSKDWIRKSPREPVGVMSFSYSDQWEFAVCDHIDFIEINSYLPS